MKIITIVGLFLMIMSIAPISAGAQNKSSAPNRPADWPTTGQFTNGNGVFRIDSIDTDGNLHGFHTGLNDRGYQKPWDQFTARVGADGYPEYTVAGGTNRYIHMHACGANLCAMFYQPYYGQKSPIVLQRQ